MSSIALHRNMVRCWYFTFLVFADRSTGLDSEKGTILGAFRSSQALARAIGPLIASFGNLIVLWSFSSWLLLFSKPSGRLVNGQHTSAVASCCCVRCWCFSMCKNVSKSCACYRRSPSRKWKMIKQSNNRSKDYLEFSSIFKRKQNTYSTFSSIPSSDVFLDVSKKLTINWTNKCFVESFLTRFFSENKRMFVQGCWVFCSF